MYKQLTLEINTLGLLKQGCIIELLNIKSRKISIYQDVILYIETG